MRLFIRGKIFISLLILFMGLLAPTSQRVVTAQERSDQFREHQQPLNVDYKEHEPYENWARTKGHNWLVNKAFKFMKYNLSVRLPSGLEEKYVHYGVAFADSPWLGLPGTFSREFPNGRRVTSIREDLWGTRPVPAQSSLEIKYNPKYDEASKEGKDRPNLYLNVRYVLSYVFGAERPIFAVDNISHYAHDTELRADGSYFCSDILAQGPAGKGLWGVKGDQYAIKLYDLARRFWPGSIERDPSLSELIKVEAPGKLSNTCGTGAHSHLEVPATYLGGNPFVLTRQGTATWPIWVPDVYSPENVIQAKPPRSKRASAIYLGWALHMLHDLSHPYHAMNKAGPMHACLEQDLDDWIQEGKFEHLPVLTPLFGGGAPKYKYSNKPVYWPDFWTEFTGEARDHCHKCSDSEMPHRFTEVIRASKASFEDIRVGCRHSLRNQLAALKQEQTNVFLTAERRSEITRQIAQIEMQIKMVEPKSLAAYEYLMDMALKNTIMMIACLVREAGVKGVVSSEQGTGVAGATLNFVSEDRTVTLSTKSQANGWFLIALPKLGRYTVTITHPDYHDYSSSGFSVLSTGGYHLANFKIRPKSASPPLSTYVTGKVVASKTNQPVGGADVCAVDKSLARTCAKTNSSGYYRIDLHPGEYRITVTHPNFSPSQKDVRLTTGYATVHFSLEHRK